MIPPTPPVTDFSWPTEAFGTWANITEKARMIKGSAGQGDALEKTKQHLKNLGKQRGGLDHIKRMLAKRIAARALTALWVEDEAYRSSTCSAELLDHLIVSQPKGLTRLTLSNLCSLFMNRFDSLGTVLLNQLGKLITQQCQRFMVPSNEAISDIWQVAKIYPWMFRTDGPQLFAKRIRQTGTELEIAFRKSGLTGFDCGRFGEICRAIYYLDELQTLPLGQRHEVMDELLKESVHTAPYIEGKLIGHAALEIIIDRVQQEPSESWQQFVLSIAGDPRIASSAASYRMWWQALGQERITKVRSWLSKLDLNLFLTAVDEYGRSSGNHELQRMFPARKRFLEGLLELKLIRNTRLMLGNTAAYNIRRMLGTDINISYAELSAGNNLNDKAVLYIDCGSFHLIEGSHSFKLWMYLAQPNPALVSYDTRHFTHTDLTTKTQRLYRERYPKLDHTEVVHNGWWQRKAFEFLASNGISINIEKLLSPTDYKNYLKNFGLPAVRKPASMLGI